MGPDAQSPPPDAALQAFIPSLVFVDALVIGEATSTSGKPLQLDDVRVCVRDQSAAANKFLSDHALPFDRPIPLTNYVGLQNGSGIDLGAAAGAVDIDVYSAFDLRNDTVWSPDPSETCASMAACSGSSCVARVRLSVVLAGNMNVVALVDDNSGDAGSSGVKTRVASFDDVEYSGTLGSIQGTIVDLSDWHAGQTIGAFYGNWQDASGTNVEIMKPLAKDTATKPGPIATTIDSYETLGLRFDQDGSQPDTFGQSLDSIAYVASPTVTPPAFYAVRENFVFALVGDPNDPGSVNFQGGRNPQFNRKGLHIAAIPYASPRPK